MTREKLFSFEPKRKVCENNANQEKLRENEIKVGVNPIIIWFVFVLQNS